MLIKNARKIVAASVIACCFVSLADDAHAFETSFVSTRIALGTGLALDGEAADPNFQLHALVGPLLIADSRPLLELVPEFGYILTVDRPQENTWEYGHLAVGGLAFGILVGNGMFTEFFADALLGVSSGETVFGVRSGLRLEWMTFLGLEIAYQWLSAEESSQEIQFLFSFDLLSGAYFGAEAIIGGYQ